MIGNTILRVLTATLTGHGPHLEQDSKKPRGLTTVSHLPQRLLYRMQKGATWMFFFKQLALSSAAGADPSRRRTRILMGMCRPAYGVIGKRHSYPLAICWTGSLIVGT